MSGRPAGVDSLRPGSACAGPGSRRCAIRGRCSLCISTARTSSPRWSRSCSADQPGAVFSASLPGSSSRPVRRSWAARRAASERAGTPVAGAAGSRPRPAARFTPTVRGFGPAVRGFGPAPRRPDAGQGGRVTQQHNGRRHRRGIPAPGRDMSVPGHVPGRRHAPGLSFPQPSSPGHRACRGLGDARRRRAVHGAERRSSWSLRTVTWSPSAAYETTPLHRPSLPRRHSVSRPGSHRPFSRTRQGLAVRDGL